MPATKISLEETILNGELSLEKIFNAFTEGVYDYNIKSKLTFVSENFYRNLGYEPDEFEITDERWDALIHPDDLERASRLFYDHLEGKIPRYYAEYRMLRKDGTYQWVSCTGKLIENDSDGQPSRVVGALRSIDVRKHLEMGGKALLHASSKLRGIEFFKHTAHTLSQLFQANYIAITAINESNPKKLKPIVVWEKDRYNESFEYVIKGTPCEVIYTDKKSLFVDTDLIERFPDDEFLKAHEIKSYYGVPFWDLSGELTGHLAIMSERKIEIHQWMEYMAGLFAKSIGSEFERIRNEEQLSELNRLLDAQVKERTVQLENAVEDLDSFFYKASHDLRAPITTLEGIYNLLSTEIDSDEKAKLFNLLGAQINGIKKLNKSIIEVGNIRNHKFESKKLMLGPLMAQAIDKLYIPVGFNLEKLIDDSIEVESDEVLLFTLIKEFVSNGIKHRDEEKGDCFVKIETVRSSNSVDIIIQDNGTGIANRFEDDYFKLFLRASPTSSGFGLGLYKAKLAADKTSIDLTIKSKEGEGTKVILAIKTA